MHFDDHPLCPGTLDGEDRRLCDCTSTASDLTGLGLAGTDLSPPIVTASLARSQSLSLPIVEPGPRTTRASSDGDIPPRPKRLNRKLPPKLTESLEILALNPSSRTTAPPSPVFTLASVTQASPTMPSSPPALRRLTPSPTSPTLRTPTSSIHQYPSSAHASCSTGSASQCGTWSSIDLTAPAKRETRKERQIRKKVEKEAFNIDSHPSLRSLYQASLLDVIAEDGTKVKFGDLVRRGRTIVIFIRFCPLCAQYVQSIVREVTPAALAEADVELVIIGNGSGKMLPGYKNKAMKCPYRMYTDPTLGIYRALGLTRQSADSGPDNEAGDYLVQTPFEATVSTLKRATQMPLRNPGHFTQLGGEFIFDGTLNTIYTHRMSTTRAHAPIRDICALAGVRLEWIHYEPGSPPPLVHQWSDVDSLRTAAVLAQNDWVRRRNREVERITSEKERRRLGVSTSVKAMRREIRIMGVDEDSEENDLFARQFGQVRFT